MKTEQFDLRTATPVLEATQDNDDRPDDFSQMSQDQLLSDSRVPQSFKERIILEMQRVGFPNFGLKKVSDFMRRDLAEEETYQALQRRGLQDWLDAMQFQFLNTHLQTFVRKQEQAADKEIDALNSTIDQLEKKQTNKASQKRSVRIENLKKARENLKSYKAELADIESQRRAADNTNDLRNVAQQTTQNANTFTNMQTQSQTLRQTTTSARRSTQTRRTRSTTPRPSTASTTHSNSSDEGDDESETFTGYTPPGSTTAQKPAVKTMQNGSNPSRPPNGKKKKKLSKPHGGADDNNAPAPDMP